MDFPKCYWIWNYRLWILNQAIDRLPPPTAKKVWEEELGLVGKMLHKDRRNFHAWGYRRYVVEKLESAQLSGRSLVESEFEYTTKKIHEDLSNFSAWHHRSQLIPRLLREREADDATRERFLRNGTSSLPAIFLGLNTYRFHSTELEMVRNGLNVGPEDQSLWFYHQYLISNISDDPGGDTIAPKLSIGERKAFVEEEIVEIKDLLEDYVDIKWIYEALILYTQVLSRLGKPELDSSQKKQLSSWLSRLKSLDPQRSGRWKDLESETSTL